MIIIKKILLILLLFVSFSAITVLFYKFVNPPVTSIILLKEEFTLTSFLSIKNYNQKWQGIQNISAYAPLAVIASEDQIFFEHFGFDFRQIEKAIKENERRRRIRGASTISQQVAKNLFLCNDKSIFRKAFEAYYTLLIELLWSKKRILEVYLNVAEMGDNIYGVEAASEIFFHKSSLKLTSAEAAFLAAVLPNPIKRKVSRPSSYLLRRKEQILTQMELIGGLPFIKEKLR
ncbi:monofunctional biosynthetic peptidoglycan transglycosylase [Melioribacteraceae bacterium 4301-Me]|uniref:monofunctional biosynthetic peptidoglycan transglycosylase n=1 Tax=Pyranulibacter aquaticus TaxID=3163344 RepID=UPI0035985421